MKTFIFVFFAATLLPGFGTAFVAAAPYREPQPAPEQSNVIAPLTPEEKGLVEQVRPNGVALHIRELNKRPVDFTTPEGAIDDQILDFARAANTNVLVDAGQLQTTAPGHTTNKGYPLAWVLGELIVSRDITYKTHDGNCLLFWKEPDLAALATMIANGNGIKPVEQPLDDRVFDEALQKYLEQNDNWKRRTHDLPVTLKLQELSPGLRRQVIAKAQERLVARPDVAVPPRLIWFKDEPWANAKMWLRKGTQMNGKPGKHFWLVLPYSVEGKIVTREATGAGWLP